MHFRKTKPGLTMMTPYQFLSAKGTILLQFTRSRQCNDKWCNACRGVINSFLQLMSLTCWGASLARKWSWCFNSIVVIHGVCGRVASARVSCSRASSGLARHKYWPNMAYMPHPAGSKDCACSLHSWMEQTRSLAPFLSFLQRSVSETCCYWRLFWMRTMRIQSIDSSNQNKPYTCGHGSMLAGYSSILCIC